jgi:hypothetical protein
VCCIQSQLAFIAIRLSGGSGRHAAGICTWPLSATAVVFAGATPPPSLHVYLGFYLELCLGLAYVLMVVVDMT